LQRQGAAGSALSPMVSTDDDGLCAAISTERFGAACVAVVDTAAGASRQAHGTKLIVLD